MNHYAETKDLVKLRYLYERYTVIDPTKVQAWINLAKLYAQAGEKEKAIATAEKAAELDENLEQSVGEFINSLNNLE